jgi:alpha-D-ribose 1-methylphosphonate 5-triphosphate synthase subunit PhnG
MGGKGDAFNLGEMTVSRCSVQLACGTVGHGYIRGRSKQAARHVALCDALLQTAEAPAIASKILSVLAARREAVVVETASKAAATRVDFFTLVRGQN